MTKYTIDYSEDATEQEGVRDLLMGRTVRLDTKHEGVLILDDGTRLKIEPNEGCGGCTAGWYEIDGLNEAPNAITRVDFNLREEGSNDVYEIFVYSEASPVVNLLTVSGYDNGWYGTGYRIKVRKATDGW